MQVTHSNDSITVSKATDQEQQQAVAQALVVMQDAPCFGQLVMTMTRVNPNEDDEQARFKVEHWMHETDGVWSHAIQPEQTNLSYCDAIDAMSAQMKVEREHMN